MNGKKKNGDENLTLKYIVFITAILELVEVIMAIAKHLIE